jgi:small subunit ribosomal protein S19e
MATMYDVPPEDLVEALAEEFDGRLDRPDWLEFTKSGEARELPPEQELFWERRGASLLRKVAEDGPVGVERLTTEYGDAKQGSNRYTVAPRHRSDGSGKLIRTLLQQLEEEGYVETAEGEGRRVTGEGRSLLDGVAEEILEELDRPDLERYA